MYYTILTGYRAMDYALEAGVTLSRYGVNGAEATHGISWMVANTISDGDSDSLFVEAWVKPRADGWHPLELGYAEVRTEGGRPRELRHVPGPMFQKRIDAALIRDELERRDAAWVDVPEEEWPEDGRAVPLVALDAQPTHFVFRRAPEGVTVRGLLVRQPAPGLLEGLTRDDLATGGPSWRGTHHAEEWGTFDSWEGADQGDVRWEIVPLPWAPPLTPAP